MQKLDEFIEGLLKQKSISVDDPEIKAEIIKDMREKLEEQINRACIQALSEEKAKELVEKVNQPDFTTEKMAKFMQDSGVDMKKITIDTMQRFRDLYLNGEKEDV